MALFPKVDFDFRFLECDEKVVSQCSSFLRKEKVLGVETSLFGLDIDYSASSFTVDRLYFELNIVVIFFVFFSIPLFSV